MEQPSKPRIRKDLTLTLGVDLVERVDKFREDINARAPGLRVSMSAAARQLIVLGLGKTA